MKITVQIEPSLRPNLPNILASASVTLETEAGAIVIHDARILLNRNGQTWFSLPTFSMAHGGYRQTLELPAAVAQQISAEALRAYEQWEQNGGRP